MRVTGAPRRSPHIRMKALRFDGCELSLDEIRTPREKGEALVRVVRSGICNTDLEIVRGYAGFKGTIGHEFVGIVEESGGVPELAGKRVVGEINVGCGECSLCLKGDPRHCEMRTVLGIKGRDGCHAEYVSLPAGNLLEVPPEVTDEAAVFTEPLAAAYGITEQVEIGPDTKTAVIGDGKLGILCAWSLGLRTRHLYLIGKHQSKLNAARTDTVEGILLDGAEKLKRSFDVVVEASGSKSGLGAAIALLKPRGRLVLKSTVHGTVEWEPWRVVVDEITVVGSRCGRFAPALDLLKEGRIDTGRLISGEFSLAEGLRAFEQASRPGALKVLIAP
jgi:threonine dehydrogenase-like Zn-dependent dehydrogenase